MPSSRYSAGALAPPLWNWILMSRPIAAEGTCRYSTGRPGRENAPAVADPPTAPIRPDSRAIPTAPPPSRRGVPATAPRNLSTSFILASSSLWNWSAPPHDPLSGPTGPPLGPETLCWGAPVLRPTARPGRSSSFCSQPQVVVGTLIERAEEAAFRRPFAVVVQQQSGFEKLVCACDCRCARGVCG